VGCKVGARRGAAEGEGVGFSEGTGEGSGVGSSVGTGVGAKVGNGVGANVGCGMLEGTGVRESNGTRELDPAALAWRLKNTAARTALVRFIMHRESYLHALESEAFDWSILAIKLLAVWPMKPIGSAPARFEMDLRDCSSHRRTLT
jgi:hypothetical protein